MYDFFIHNVDITSFRHRMHQIVFLDLAMTDRGTRRKVGVYKLETWQKAQPNH